MSNSNIYVISVSGFELSNPELNEMQAASCNVMHPAVLPQKCWNSKLTNHFIAFLVPYHLLAKEEWNKHKEHIKWKVLVNKTTAISFDICTSSAWNGRPL